METTREDIFDRIMGLPGLRILKPWYSKHKEILLYLFFGGLAVFLNLGLFILFTKRLGRLVRECRRLDHLCFIPVYHEQDLGICR